MMSDFTTFAQNKNCLNFISKNCYEVSRHCEERAKARWTFEPACGE